VRVTHPFHPLAGEKLEFVKRRKNWRADRVYVFDAAGELVSLPAEWTDVVAADPFVVVAGGALAVPHRRAARAVRAGGADGGGSAEQRRNRCQADYAVNVLGIMPRVPPIWAFDAAKPSRCLLYP
jgi:hypothetical protein